MISFTESEKKFLTSHEEARLASTHKDTPHVKPVSYIFHSNFIFVATDYDTRTYKNIKENPKTAISIDIYKPGGHKAVLIQGNAEISIAFL